MKKIKQPTIKAFPFGNVLSVLANLAIVYVLYMITRVAFVLENWSTGSNIAADWDQLSLWEVFIGGLRFDTSAIFYTNSLWIILMLIPIHTKERLSWWPKLCKWVFVVINSFCLTLNLVDSVFSNFNGDRRITASFFTEFSNEGNLGGIFFTELVNHWYLLLLGIALIAVLWLFYFKPDNSPLETKKTKQRTRYYIVTSLGLLIAIPMSIFAMRGGFTRDTRPITISNANQYVHSPKQAAIVLNTPFSIIRTIGKRPFKDPHYMSEEEMNGLYSPIHIPESDGPKPLVSGRKNVMVIILESFSREYTGFYNPDRNETYTPFLDSLLAHSLTFERTFANGRHSIDAMPSALSSVPYFVEPFILTPSSLNDLSGIADCLGKEGYTTAFFHGAPNSSMGFQAFARSSGFQHYFGMSEYCDDPRFNGDADFNGYWAIWDEDFLQYTSLAITENLKEPFVAGIFTATSHHPFNVPERYEKVFTEGPLPIHRAIKCSDHALRLFFETARKQPWFYNTLFVFTADHTNMLQYPESNTSLGVFSIPIAIYDPSGELPCGIKPGIAQQIDIMPTVLSILGYDKPYLAFGKNLLADSTFSSHDSTLNWAVNFCNDIYQYIENDYLLQFDGERATALYNYITDPLLKNNLLNDSGFKAQYSELIDHLTLRLKAIIQSYMQRMLGNRLVIRPEDLGAEKK